MTNEEKTKKVKELLANQDIFAVKDVTDVNHDPHPFTIGPKHVAHAADNHGGRLGDATLEAVSCAVSGCNLSYTEHKSDKVCFLQLQRNATNDEANTILKELVDELGEDFVDGFAFVETEEKYRVS